MQRKSADYDTFFGYVGTLFDTFETELRRETPFQLLVAVMLSAQSTDKQVNKITDQLFLSVREPEDVISMGQEDLEQAVSSVNYYRMKAKHLFQTAEILVAWKNELSARTTVIPERTEELLKLP